MNIAPNLSELAGRTIVLTMLAVNTVTAPDDGLSGTDLTVPVTTIVDGKFTVPVKVMFAHVTVPVTTCTAGKLFTPTVSVNAYAVMLPRLYPPAQNQSFTMTHAPDLAADQSPDATDRNMLSKFIGNGHRTIIFISGIDRGIIVRNDHHAAR